MRSSIINRVLSKFGFQALVSGREVEVVNLKEIKALRAVFSYFSFLLLAWGLYRYLFRFPENIEELVLKPLIWLGSLAWVVKKVEKKPLSSLAAISKNWRQVAVFSLGFGLLFVLEGLVINLIEYGQLGLVPWSYSLGQLAIVFFVSLATAVVEEYAFRGFIFYRLWKTWQKEWAANILTSVLFSLVHLPITIFVLHYNFFQLMAYSLIVFIYSLGSGFVFVQTETVLASVFLHVLWRWPVILFR